MKQRQPRRTEAPAENGSREQITGGHSIESFKRAKPGWNRMSRASDVEEAVACLWVKLRAGTHHRVLRIADWEQQLREREETMTAKEVKL